VVGAAIRSKKRKMKGNYNGIGYRLVLAQFFVTLLLTGVLLIVAGTVAAYSAFTGGMIATLTSAYFAVKLFSDSAGWQPKQLASTVFRGESGKLVLTGALFLMAIMLIRPLSAAALFSAYLLVQLSPLLAVNRLKND